MTAVNASSFSITTNEIINVLYSYKYCNRTYEVYVLCSYFRANLRSTKHSNQFIWYNYQSNKVKFEDKLLNKHKPNSFVTQKNTAVIRNIGLVCNYDINYRIHPSLIYYRSHDITAHQWSKVYFPQKPIFHPRIRSFISNNCGHSVKHEYHKNFNNEQNIKYWYMRYMLFFKFDLGIRLDEESLYSVCPEVLSRHIARRCAAKVALDAFCGVGGNAIQLAFTCDRVIAVDIDPMKIQMARHNAAIYKVAHKIDFIVGDIFELYPDLKANVLFMSPPWGGPGYSRKNYSLASMCSEQLADNRLGLFDVAKTIAPNIAFHMPKTTNVNECVCLAKKYGRVEIQQNIINGKLNSITAFYGHFLT